MEWKKYINKLASWVKKNKQFAIALPIVLGLMSFLVAGNIKSMQNEGVPTQSKDSTLNSFITELPGKNPELKEKDNHELWLEGQKATEQEAVLPVDVDRERDSINEIVKRLEAISMESEQKRLKEQRTMAVTSLSTPPRNAAPVEPPKTQQQLDLEYMEQQMALKEKLHQRRMELSPQRDNQNAGVLTSEAAATQKGGVAFRAVIYRDQWVLPDQVAQLILTDDVFLDGKLFKKNTILHAVIGINKNRVLFTVNNINHIPVSVSAKDYNDGMVGLYSERAGELWNEYKANTQGDLINEIANSGELSKSRVVTSTVRGLASFFKRKKLKDKDKIFLQNERELLMVTVQ